MVLVASELGTIACMAAGRLRGGNEGEDLIVLTSEGLVHIYNVCPVKVIWFLTFFFFFCLDGNR